MLHNMPNKMKHDFVRENYTRRALQVSIEVQNDSSFNLSEINKRIATDPTILTSCFQNILHTINKTIFLNCSDH